MNFTQQIKIKLLALATISGKELNEMALNAFIEALSDLEPSAVLASLQDWLRTGKGFPYPADIRAKVMPDLDPKDNAIDAVNRIITAIGRFGYTNPKQARDFIGELGWETVERFGGWLHLCENVNSENEGMFRAQLRELAVVVSKKSMRGELDKSPALPDRTNVQQIISGAMKRIGGGE